MHLPIRLEKKPHFLWEAKRYNTKGRMLLFDYSDKCKWLRPWTPNSYFPSRGPQRVGTCHPQERAIWNTESSAASIDNWGLSSLLYSAIFPQSLSLQPITFGFKDTPMYHEEHVQPLVFSHLDLKPFLNTHSSKNCEEHSWRPLQRSTFLKSYQNLSNPSRGAEKCHLTPSESELLFYQLSKDTMGNVRFNLYAKRIYALEPEIRVTEITIITETWDHFSRNETK